MASSARRKQDEKNLKVVRELVSLSHNKYCFDCNQRGPTYVNVTIGSFVCTKCSGLLRGLTPPHRVKSISMTTFSVEEVEVMRQRGNDYCHRVWLGLFTGTLPAQDAPRRDESQVHQLMIDKYERRLYYLEPGSSLQHFNNKPVETTTKKDSVTIATPQQQLTSNLVVSNGISKQPPPPPNNDFVADFDHADIFNNNNNGVPVTSQTQTTSFANFDNNPAFNNIHINGGPLQNNNSKNSVGNTVLQQQQRQGAPPPSLVNHQPSGGGGGTLDKYAALKDLDNELKTTTTTAATPGGEWGGSSGSLYSGGGGGGGGATSTGGSGYSASPHSNSSSYGSPTTSTQGGHHYLYNDVSNGHHINNGHHFNGGGSGHSNPFNGGNNGGIFDMWSACDISNNKSFSATPVVVTSSPAYCNGNGNNTANPFNNANNGSNAGNGGALFGNNVSSSSLFGNAVGGNNAQLTTMPNVSGNNGGIWGQHQHSNPFKLTTTTTNGHHSNNPFL